MRRGNTATSFLKAHFAILLSSPTKPLDSMGRAKNVSHRSLRYSLVRSDMPRPSGRGRMLSIATFLVATPTLRRHMSCYAKLRRGLQRMASYCWKSHETGDPARAVAGPLHLGVTGGPLSFNRRIGKGLR